MKKIVPCLLIINFSLFIISLVISFVIIFRPFYYWHINYLELPKETGLKYSEIKEAYDDILDYCVYHKSFSTGKLKYSDEGKDHFKDCKILFMINFIIFGISSIVLIIKRKYYNNIKLFNYNICFWSSILNLSMFLLILITSLIVGFNKIFTIFHNIFFLGKTNWVFDPNKDEIIRILPEEFFMNCGITIISLISVISIMIIIFEICKKKHFLKISTKISVKKLKMEIDK